MNDVMVDLETLATTADAVILSIGAVRFDLDAGLVFDEPESVFYRGIAIDSQPNRKISGDTLAWWMMQSEQARAVFVVDPQTSIFNALDDLVDWIDPQPGSMPTMWSNGADFDLPMLTHAFKQEGLDPPWKPYSGRCYRTYKNLPGARSVKVLRQGLHHNALDDAIFQAKHLCAIHRALFSKEVAT